MVPPIPHELSDHIIDFLHNDCRGLSACSLTCRAWLAAARYHRFAETAVWGRLGPFIDLLDASPGFAPYVRTLLLDGIAYPLRRRIDPTAMIDVLGRLPSLQQLGLTNFELDAPLVAAMSNSSSFTRLGGLLLTRCRFSSESDLVRFIRAPSLGHLSVDELDCLVNDFGDTMLPPPIESLSVSGSWDAKMTNMVRWLLHSTQDTAVRKLRVSILSRVEAKHVAELLDSVGGALQQLEVVVDPEANLEGNVFTPLVCGTPIRFLELAFHSTVVFSDAALSLARLSNLRRCHLTFKLREMFVAGTPSLPWINSMVAQLSAACLERLALCIQADNMEDLRALDSECGVRAVSPVRFEDLRLLDWAGIHQTFAGSALQQIVVEGQGDPASLRTYVAEQWPELSRLLHCRRARQGL